MFYDPKVVSVFVREYEEQLSRGRDPPTKHYHYNEERQVSVVEEEEEVHGTTLHFCEGRKRYKRNRVRSVGRRIPPVLVTIYLVKVKRRKF